MAKHRMSDRVISVGSLEDIPFTVKQLAAEHFERDVLRNIFENTKVSNLKKYGNSEGFSEFFSTITNSLVKLMLLCFITRKLTTQEMLLVDRLCYGKTRKQKRRYWQENY